MVKALQPEKAVSPILVRHFGKEIPKREMQPLKACPSMFFRPCGSTTVFKAARRAKVLFPMTETFSGITTSVSAP